MGGRDAKLAVVTAGSVEATRSVVEVVVVARVVVVVAAVEVVGGNEVMVADTATVVDAFSRATAEALQPASARSASRGSRRFFTAP